jgi:uncharacterized protein (DUF1778 family)
MHTEHFDSHKSERISIRLDADAKRKIEQAAMLDHRSITSFIIASAIESADEILQRGDHMVLSDSDWDIFYDALNHPPQANKVLRQAFAEYTDMNIKSDI